MLIKESNVLFELRWGVCGANFFCVLGQLLGKANKAVWKEKIFNYQKNAIHNFLRNWKFQVTIFKKMVRNSRIAKPYFTPCY